MLKYILILFLVCNCVESDEVPYPWQLDGGPD